MTHTPAIEPAAASTTAELNTANVVAAEKPRPVRGTGSLITVIAFLAMHLAAFSIFFVDFYWWAPVLAVGLFILRGFGITAGYHRYFAHRAFKTGRVFQFLLGCMGASALQRGPIWWAGHHRTHHKFSDEPEDPHSPIADTVWWSHIGWVISNRFNATEWDLMKDFKKYPEIKILEKFDLVPGVLMGVLCGVLGGLTGLCWFFASTVVLYHSTFMVNSVCHLFGRRRFATKDHSRNNWFVAFFTLGEGWHNNHHHYPSSARQGFKWYEYDLSYYILKALSWIGIVWDLREPTPRALASKLNSH